MTARAVGALLAGVALLALLAPSGRAQGAPGGKGDDLSLLLGGAPAGPEVHAAAEVFSRVVDDALRVVIRVEVDEPWHLYHHEIGGDPGAEGVGLPTEVTLEAPGVTFSGVLWPAPEALDQSLLPGSSWAWVHHGTLLLRAVGELGPDARPAELSVTLDGLTCLEDGACVLYRETLATSGAGPDALFEDFPADPSSWPPERVSGGPAAAADADGGASPDGRAFTPVGGELGERGLLTWLLLAFVAGALLNVMPCVLPVISIKVLSFVQQAGEDKRRVLALGLSFAAGIVVVFMLLAAAAAGAGAAWGEQFQSETFQVAMIALVFAFSLSLFGVFELGVPAGVGSLAGTYREGLGDAFAKGMLATALATPCSGPFLGSTLTWTLSQTTLTIFAVFLALGVGMAAPYVVLTANPALLKKLPKPGAWMETFKQAMGFLLLATVLYLFTIVRSDRLLFVTFFLLFVALGCWWWGRFAGWDKSRGKRLAHLAVALAIVAGGWHLSLVRLPAQLESDAEHWQAYTPETLEAALADGRSVLLDFTADWCPNCKWNEAYVYESEPVLEAVARKDVLMLKADLTDDTPETDAIEAFMAQLGSRSIPFMAIFPGDAPEAPRVFRDIVTQGSVLEVLESLPSP